MKINLINQTFGAKFINTDGATRVSKMLDRASNYDVFYTNYFDYKKLCKEINEFLPNDEDEISFNSVKDLDIPNDVTYRVDGTIKHEGKIQKFGTLTYCEDGSFRVGKRIINSIKKAIGIENTDIF